MHWPIRMTLEMLGIVEIGACGEQKLFAPRAPLGRRGKFYSLKKIKP